MRKKRRLVSDNMVEKSRIRVCLLLDDENLQRWEYESVKNLLKNENVSLDLILINNEKKNDKNFFKSSGSRLFNELSKPGNLPSIFFFSLTGFLSKYSKHNFYSIHYEKPFNVYNMKIFENVRKIHINPIKVSSKRRCLPENIVEELKKFDLGVLFGLWIVVGDVLSAPRKGVVSFHHGNIRKYRGRPTGFWEYLNDEKKAGVTLQRVNDCLDGGEIIHYNDVDISDVTCWNEVVERLYAASDMMLYDGVKSLFSPGFKPVKPEHIGRLYFLPGFQDLWFFLKKDFHKNKHFDSFEVKFACVFNRCFSMNKSCFFKKLFRLYFKIYSKIISIIQQSKLDVYFLKGVEKNSKGELGFFLLTNDLFTVEFFSDLVFEKELKREKLGKKSINKISKFDFSEKNADMIFVNTEGFFKNTLERNGFVLTPRMVSMNLDVSDSLDDISKNFNDSVKQRIRRLRHYDYSYEVVDDIDSFDFFYYDMYLPYSRSRFGNHALINSYNQLKYVFDNGRLIFIKHNEKRVYGLLICDVETDKSELEYVGIIDGSLDYLKKEAGIACNYFTILWAKENGINNLDYGLCCSFLNDGILQHNRQWGVRVNRYSWDSLRRKCREVVGIKICNFNVGSASFLLNNPFIYLDSGKVKSMVFVEEDKKVTEELIQSYKRKYLLPNIDDLIIKTPSFLSEKEYISEK